MIRCEKCGHKLKDEQKICDICNTPVTRSNEDFEFEDELMKSIATIVENETSDAKAYVKQMGNKYTDNSSTNSDKDVLGVSQRSQSVGNSQGKNSSNNSNTKNSNTNNSTSGSSNNMNTSGKSGMNQSRSASPNKSGSQGSQSGKSAQSSQSGKSGQSKPQSSQARQNQSKSSSQSRTSTQSRSGVQSSKSRQSSQTKKKKKSNKGLKITLIVIAVLLAISGVIALAFYTINYFFTKSRDNFAYYNNTGIQYVKEGKYQEAIPYLQKAITYEEAKNNVNLRFSLYDCYAATSNVEMAMEALYSVLELDPYNLEAIVSLESYYENAGATEALIEMYDKYKDSPASAAVSKYYVESPTITINGGDYSSDIDVAVSSDYGFDIYYTVDGTEPTANSIKYTGPITISEGTTTLSCVAVNPYKIQSNTVAETYTIVYTAPKAATISPKSGTYASEQMIVIGNIPAGGAAYYTTDGTTPNKNSTKYVGPFDMPSGNNILSVIVYDKNGLKSEVVQRNYVLNIETKISKDEGMNLVWNAMEYHHMVDQNHLSSDAEPVSLQFFDKIDVEDKKLWAFEIIVSTEDGDLNTQYMMGTDTETGFVYTIYNNNGVYTLDQVMY